MLSKNKLPSTGVTFVDSDNNRLHTFNEFSLMWNMPNDGEEIVTSPEIRTHTIEDLPGTDGIIDLTEHFGEIRYKNRDMTLRFTDLHGNMEEWELNRERIFNKLHGRKFQIYLDTDPEYYWEGRVSVTDALASKAVSDIVITADVHPYKKRIYENQLTATVSTSQSVTIVNTNRMPVTVTITTDQALTVVYDGETYSFDIGTEESDFELPEGSNTLKIASVSGDNASVTINWREGSL